jgi:uridine phosphorylase
MDGELVERLVSTGRAERDASWPCFHTKLYRWTVGATQIGVVGGTVGAPFAVLVAEELFASGCQALVTMTSAGLIGAASAPPFFVLIDRALRDEGTSHHYLAPARYAEATMSVNDAVHDALSNVRTPVVRGASWTTDAPFRETETLIAARGGEGIVCVEMEAAALLAMGSALRRRVVCLAHVTNAMATRPDDFEKGGHDGQEEALDVCARAVTAVLSGGAR